MKATVLLTISGPNNVGTTEIISADGVYAVFYDGAPFNERNRRTSLPRYDRPIYPNRGRALETARRLNKLFGTDKFTVHQMKPLQPPLEDYRGMMIAAQETNNAQ